MTTSPSMAPKSRPSRLAGAASWGIAIGALLLILEPTIAIVGKIPPKPEAAVSRSSAVPSLNVVRWEFVGMPELTDQKADSEASIVTTMQQQLATANASEQRPTALLLTIPGGNVLLCGRDANDEIVTQLVAVTEPLPSLLEDWRQRGHDIVSLGEADNWHVAVDVDGETQHFGVRPLDWQHHRTAGVIVQRLSNLSSPANLTE